MGREIRIDSKPDCPIAFIKPTTKVMGFIFHQIKL